MVPTDKPDDEFLEIFEELCPVELENAFETNVEVQEAGRKQMKQEKEYLFGTAEDRTKADKEVLQLKIKLMEKQKERNELVRGRSQSMQRYQVLLSSDGGLQKVLQTLAYLRTHSSEKRYAKWAMTKTQRDLGLTSILAVRRLGRIDCLKKLYKMYNHGLGEHPDFPDEKFYFGKGSATVWELQNRIIRYLGLRIETIVHLNDDAVAQDFVEGSGIETDASVAAGEPCGDDADDDQDRALLQQIRELQKQREARKKARLT